jgi:hypothetical protein
MPITFPSATSSSFSATARTLTAASVPLEAARPLFSDPIKLSDEARQRLLAEAQARQVDPDAVSAVSSSQDDLATLLKRPALRDQVDLSTVSPSLAFSPHAADFDELLSAPGLSAEARGQIADAVQRVTGYGSQVSNDPAVDLTVRKMKLDYIRDNLVPESLRPQADAAIASYVSHTGADVDQMSAKLDAMALDIARQTGRDDRAQALQRDVAGYASGAASSQQYRTAMLALVDGKRYDSPQQASVSSASSFAAIRKALLENVATWPREQKSGAAAVDLQLKQVQADWARFVARFSPASS